MRAMSVFGEDEPVQLLEPVLYENDLRRGVSSLSLEASYTLFIESELVWKDLDGDLAA